MEDDLNFLANGRQPQSFGKWKMTINIWQSERRLQYLSKLKMACIIWQNGRQPHFFGKWKTTFIISIEDGLNIKGDGRPPTLFGKMEDNLNLKVYGRRPQFVGN